MPHVLCALAPAQAMVIDHVTRQGIGQPVQVVRFRACTTIATGMVMVLMIVGKDALEMVVFYRMETVMTFGRM